MVRASRVSAVLGAVTICLLGLVRAAAAADLGGDCCTDLDDRVAALERDVDPIVVPGVVDPMADAVLLLPLAVVARGDARVEDE